MENTANNESVLSASRDKPKILIWVESLLGKGHLPQIDEYASILVKKGYDVHVVSSSFWRGPELNYGGATLHDLGDNMKGDKKLRIHFNAKLKVYTTPDNVPLENARNFFSLREEKLENIIAKVSPDAIVTDHYPFARGNLPDIHNVIKKIGQKRKDGIPIIIGEARDVIGAFSGPSGGSKESAEDIIQNCYDAIFVMSDPHYCEFQSGIDPTCYANKIQYVGYQGSKKLLTRDSSISDEERKIIMAGGSSQTTEWFAFVKQVIHVYQSLPNDNPLKKHELIIYLSPDYSEEQFGTIQKLGKQVSQGRITVSRNVPIEQFRNEIVNASHIISHAGVNQAIEVLASGVPSIMAARELHAENNEQSIRAQEFCKKGAPLIILPIEDWNSQSAVTEAMLDLSRQKFLSNKEDIKLNGGANLADATESLFKGKGIDRHQPINYQHIFGSKRCVKI
jgi:predicted glycosyltransferase